MGQSIRRGKCLRTDIAVIQVSIGIPLYLYDPVPFSPDEKRAPAMIHPGAVRFHPSRVIGHETILPGASWLFHVSHQHCLESAISCLHEVFAESRLMVL